MLAILSVVAWLLVGVLAFALILLALLLWGPVQFAGQGKVRLEGDQDTALAPREAEFHGQISFLWGALRASEAGARVFWWPVGGKPGRGRPIASESRGQATDNEPAQVAKERQPAQGRRRPWAGLASRLTLREVRALLPEVRRALARTWAALHLSAQADVTLGLDDPATTGILAGAIPAAGYVLTARANARRPGSIGYSFRPVFDREVLAAEFGLTGRTTLGSIAWPWIRLALQPDVRRLWWPLRRRNSKGGESNDVQ